MKRLPHLIIVCYKERTKAMEVINSLYSFGFQKIFHFKQAEDMIRDIGDSIPDLIISDFDVGGKFSGINVLKVYNKLYPQTQIIVLIRDNYEYELIANTVKSCHILEKPFSEAELEKTIEECLGIKVLSQS